MNKPGASKSSINPMVMIGLVVSVIVAAVVVTVLVSSSKPAKKVVTNPIAATVTQRHAVGLMFLAQHAQALSLVASYKTCQTLSCFDTKIHSIDQKFSVDQVALSQINFPARAQHTLGLYGRVIGAIRIDFTAVLKKLTLAQQKMLFNKLLIDGPQPLIVRALYNQASALISSMLTN